MEQQPLPSHAKVRYSKPRIFRDWKSIVRICAIPALALAGLLAWMYEEHNFRTQKATTWTTTVAAIENTRIRPIANHPMEYGGTRLYEVDVFVTYTVNGNLQKEWLPLSEPPQKLAEATSQETSLKGKQCFVRWSPSYPQQKLAELD